MAGSFLQLQLHFSCHGPVFNQSICQWHHLLISYFGISQRNITFITWDWNPFSTIEAKRDRTGKKAAMTDHCYFDSLNIFQGP